MLLAAAEDRVTRVFVNLPGGVEVEAVEAVLVGQVVETRDARVVDGDAGGKVALGLQMAVLEVRIRDAVLGIDLPGECANVVTRRIDFARAPGG